MRIQVTPEVRQYLATRSPHVTVYFPEMKVQCCVPYSAPELRVGAPDGGEAHLAVKAEEITVHIPEAVAKHQDELTVVLRGFGPFKSLALEGWRAFGAIS